jgi:flagellar hook-basal body complex protein FliE
MVDINTNMPMATIASAANPQAVGAPDKQDGTVSFGQFLNQSIQEVNKLQKEADLAARSLVTGENKDIHGTMIAMQKSGVAMELMIEVRNKVISAYDEIKRMQF